jgi:hypothetical protein
MVNDLLEALGISTVYAPNIYQPHPSVVGIPHQTPRDKHPNLLDVGCFGAIRPLKNQLVQAMAAMAFADELEKTLHFHINHSRQEQNGENVYKNLVSLFQGTKHKLIEHEWVLHEEFIRIIRGMDFGLQISFSETFNIVAADFVHVKVPVIGSEEIEWLNPFYKSSATNLNDILMYMRLAWYGKKINLHYLNNLGLEHYNLKARKVWGNYLDF